ncbi:MAG: hypothetical protein KKC20_13105 [Proteobacteria bacterium]|nr:hypothetical protein [Pseudomonadota bacterium]
MPLSFPSISHGNIAFGFFNIESDMLLMEGYFFFADQFCKWMRVLAQQEDDANKSLKCRVFHISDPRDVGNLMGAIHGQAFTGFMGNLYTLFPFPKDPRDFKQNPKGGLTRKIVVKEIQKFAVKKQMCIEFSKEGTVHMGPYVFDRKVFCGLIQYVWQGGYPRWKDEIRPAYVVAMKEQLQAGNNRFFKGMFSSGKN